MKFYTSYPHPAKILLVQKYTFAQLEIFVAPASTRVSARRAIVLSTNYHAFYKKCFDKKMRLN